MDVKYDQAQDLTLTLSRVEKERLLGAKPWDFHQNSLRGMCPELEAPVFLAYSMDEGQLLANARLIGEDIGRVHIPDVSLKGYPWLINLSDKGADFLRDGWNYGVRYDGGSKLFILTREF